MPQTESISSASWESVSNGRRKLYGSAGSGLRVEEHSFRIHSALDWGEGIQAETLEICLNLAGSGRVQDGKASASYQSRTLGFYGLTDSSLSAVRSARESHTFVTLGWSREGLSRQVAGLEDSLSPAVRKWLSRDNGKNCVGPVESMSAADENSLSDLRRPPVAAAAAQLWYESKANQLLAQCLFEKPKTEEMFCHRHQRLAHERVEHVIALLKSNLSQTPDLETLSRQVGCSPFYLSRTFSREMKQSIPQYLRGLRMQRAAELLRSGEYNVTEAALEVGYSSLGHFSKAFCEATGCCPSLYPRAEHLIKPGF